MRPLIEAGHVYLAQPPLYKLKWAGKEPIEYAFSDRERDGLIKIGVEAAVRQGWDQIIGNDGIFVGMTGFGASAPYKDLYKNFGITAEAIAEKAVARL